MLIPKSHRSSKLDEEEGRELKWEERCPPFQASISFSCFCSMSTAKSIQWRLESGESSLPTYSNVSHVEDLYTQSWPKTVYECDVWLSPELVLRTVKDCWELRDERPWPGHILRAGCILQPFLLPRRVCWQQSFGWMWKLQTLQIPKAGWREGCASLPPW